MNTKNEDQFSPSAANQFGLAAAALLRQGSQSLPPQIKDRLYAARLKALSLKKPEKAFVHSFSLANAPRFGGSFFRTGSLWDTFGWLAPLVVLVFGLVGIAQWQADSRINDIAEVDAALLTDDVPPDAYADSGFLQFLKNGSSIDGNSSPSHTLDASPRSTS
ncbi:Protein of unknown function [Polynucleobacter meluiroseus]|uniref:DUF3619 domain-containing protein n=1 Tax=Polynucleobacter meluiroseus TaxID=1938814 RepID=A0A240DZ13_9BURK|nr:DUF3619 family protein [Polynucleobacter meluiroseus]SNX28425.1 Protein of unknown function [Polynucleobacter meluiroseus]